MHRSARCLAIASFALLAQACASPEEAARWQAEEQAAMAPPIATELDGPPLELDLDLTIAAAIGDEEPPPPRDMATCRERYRQCVRDGDRYQHCHDEFDRCLAFVEPQSMGNRN